MTTIAGTTGARYHRSAAPSAPHWWSDWGPLEWFVVVQYLSTALLFVPGAQSVRIIIRTLPYLLGGILFFAGYEQAGSTLNLADGATGAFTLAQEATFGTAATFAGATLRFEIAAQKIAVAVTLLDVALQARGLAATSATTVRTRRRVGEVAET